MEVREPSAKYLAKAAYKQTEVGVIPEDWDVRPLAELVSFLDGRRKPVKDSDRAKMQGAIPYYGASGIVDYVNDYLFDDELILLGEDGENILSRNCRLAFRVSGKVWVNNHAHVLKPNPEMDIGYLADYLESLNYERYNSGTAQPKLNKQASCSIPVAVPPLPEQQAIAEALSDADALIETLEQLLAKKCQIKQGAMQQLLTGQKRLPGFAGEWVVKRLDELGRWVGGMTPSMRNPDYWTPAEIPWISSGDVKATTLFGTAFSISEYAVKERATTVIPERSIVVVMRSGILRNYLPVAMAMLPMAINQDVKAILPSRGVSPDYLLHALVGNGDRILARCLKSGTTVESIEFPWLKAFGIHLPPIEEQTAIATLLSDMDAEIAALEAKLGKARGVKQGMMQELLTGRIRLV